VLTVGDFQQRTNQQRGTQNAPGAPEALGARWLVADESLCLIIFSKPPGGRESLKRQNHDFKIQAPLSRFFQSAEMCVDEAVGGKA